MSADGRYRRPALVRTRPDRHFSGYYRSAENGDGGGEIPRSAEQAIVQAVRMAYRVAEEQISRSARLASRLKRAGDAEAGPDGDRQALDALARLALKAAMAGLGWMEAAAAEPGSPLRRAASAQYHLVGSLLGLSANGNVAPAHEPPPEAAPAPRAPVGARPPPKTRIVYAADAARRPVLDQRERLQDLPDASAFDAHFYSATARAAEPITGTLETGTAGERTLRLPMRADCQAGWWAAAICSPDGTLLGHVEIRL